MSESWTVDDDRILSTDTLYRRVPRDNPDFMSKDLLTNEPTFHPAAFRYTDDGMSVSREELLRTSGQSVKDLPWPPEKYVIAQFPVAAVRPRGGVVDKPDPKDSVTGHAHALVRTPAPPPDKATWGAVRQAIMEQAIPLDLSP